jgi:hypothetical protein
LVQSFSCSQEILEQLHAEYQRSNKCNNSGSCLRTCKSRFEGLVFEGLFENSKHGEVRSEICSLKRSCSGKFHGFQMKATLADIQTQATSCFCLPVCLRKGFWLSHRLPVGPLQRGKTFMFDNLSRRVRFSCIENWTSIAIKGLPYSQQSAEPPSP